MSVPGTAARPASVTLVVFLTLLAGVLDVIAGAVTWAFAGSDKVQSVTETGQGLITTIAVLSLLTGLLTILVGLGLRSGSGGARMLVTLLMVVRAGVAVWALATLGTHNLVESLFALAFSALILGLLWNSKANDFFA